MGKMLGNLASLFQNAYTLGALDSVNNKLMHGKRLVDASNNEAKAVESDILAAQWTKVEDGLPETMKRHRVWVTHPNGSLIDWEMYAYLTFGNTGLGEDEYVWQDWEKKYRLDGTVTHWQPITAPGE